MFSLVSYDLLTLPAFETDASLPERFVGLIGPFTTVTISSDTTVYRTIEIFSTGQLVIDASAAFEIAPDTERDDTYATDGDYSARIEIEAAVTGLTVSQGRNAVYREIDLAVDDLYVWRADVRGSGTHELRVTDDSGVTITSQTIVGTAGWQTVQVACEPGSAGTYHLVLEADDSGSTIYTDRWYLATDLEALGFYVQEARGVAAPPVQDVSTDYAILDGTRYDRTRYQTRTIVLSGTVDAADEDAYRQARRALFAALNPHTRTLPVALYHQYGETDSESLIIDVVYERGLDNFDYDHPPEFEVVFTAYDPFWSEIV
jgi:hypothetical protein